MDGPSERQGNVEYCVNNTWYTVIHAPNILSPSQEASVICRQLGYSPVGTFNELVHVLLMYLCTIVFPQVQPFIFPVLTVMQCTWTTSLCAREQSHHWRSVCLSFLLSAMTTKTMITITTTMAAIVLI